MAESTIITGQFVRISQTPASLGERMLALMIDYLLLFVYVVGISILFQKVEILNTTKVSFYLLFALLCAPAFCYSLLFEIFNKGQTWGKQLLKIRVVKADGSTPSLSAYLLRWLLLPIDLLVTGGLGVLSILLTKNSQRLGDLAAGTMVVKEKNYRQIQVSLDEFDYLSQGYRPVYSSASDLTLEQVQVITKTLVSVKKDREHRIQTLAEKVRSLLAIKSIDNHDEKFLETVVRDYQYYALEDIMV